MVCMVCVGSRHVGMRSASCCDRGNDSKLKGPASPDSADASVSLHLPRSGCSFPRAGEDPSGYKDLSSCFTSCHIHLYSLPLGKWERQGIGGWEGPSSVYHCVKWQGAIFWGCMLQPRQCRGSVAWASVRHLFLATEVTQMIFRFLRQFSSLRKSAR